MPTSHTKLHLFLLLTLVILAGLLIYQIVHTAGISTTTAKTPLISLETYAVPLSGTEPTLGNPGAPNTIILFADLGDRRSKEVFKTLTNFVKRAPDKFKLVFKDAPEPTLFFRSSIRAHVGSACAGEQQKFWPFAEQVFSSRDYLIDVKLTQLASDLKLNTTSWSACFTASSTMERIQEEASQYRREGISKVPTLFINGKRINLVKEIKLEDILNSLIQ